MSDTQHFQDEAPRATRSTIRLYRVDLITSCTPLSNLPNEWQVCSPETVAQFSGVAYHFGQMLSEELGQNGAEVPIGLIQSAWGGSEIEPWIPHAGFAAVPSLQTYMDGVEKMADLGDDGVTPQTPAAMYNAMIHPLSTLSMRGILWYQGEF